MEDRIKALDKYITNNSRILADQRLLLEGYKKNLIAIGMRQEEIIETYKDVAICTALIKTLQGAFRKTKKEIHIVENDILVLECTLSNLIQQYNTLVD